MADERAPAGDLDRALDLHERFQEALDSSQKLALEDFERRSRAISEELDKKKKDFDCYFLARLQALEAARAQFRLAQLEALAAAERLREVQAELLAQRDAKLQEVHGAAMTLLASLRQTLKLWIVGGLIAVAHSYVAASCQRRLQAPPK